LSTLDEILWSLKDGKWHSLTEITHARKKSSSPEPSTKMALSFLWEYNFIQINEDEEKAKLCPLVFNFIDEIQRIEKEETSSHKSFQGTIGINEFTPFHRSLEKI
jgi:hypothetical protein